MYIERRFVLDAPRPRAWAFLNEPEEVGRCLPGCHGVEVLGQGKYMASVGIKVGPIKAAFDVQVDTSEERPPEFAAFTMRGADKDGASKISADCTLALADLEGQRTEVTYTSKVHIVGRLGKFAGGVMQKVADGVNDQFIEALTVRMSELAGTAIAPETAASESRGVWAAFVKLLSRLLRGLRGVFGRQRSETVE